MRAEVQVHRELDFIYVVCDFTGWEKPCNAVGTAVGQVQCSLRIDGEVMRVRETLGDPHDATIAANPGNAAAGLFGNIEFTGRPED